MRDTSSTSRAPAGRRPNWLPTWLPTWLLVPLGAWALSTGPLAACQSSPPAKAAEGQAPPATGAASHVAPGQQAAQRPAHASGHASGQAPAAGSAASAAPAQARAAAPKASLPRGVDPKDLDADEQALLAAVLREQFDPCGGSVSFYDSLASPHPCERAQRLAAKLVALTAQGLSKRQLTKALWAELSRTKAKAVFSLAGRPPLGDPAKARHVIVEFTDFQCPYCRRAAGEIKAAARAHGAVLYVKHMPLPQHAAARPAARVAAAAARQGKFWEVYDALFAHQDALTAETVAKIAVDAGVDAAKLREALADPSLDALIQQDEDEGDAAGVDGTPTVFVDGYRVDLDDLERTLAAD